MRIWIKQGSCRRPAGSYRWGVAAQCVTGCLAISMICLLAPWAQSQRPKLSEYQVKAAYLYNFGKFVEWPANEAPEKQESFEICVLGDDPFGKLLDSAVTGATIVGKNVAVKRITKPQEIDACRILFISSSENEHLTEILSVLEKLNVLTVSDIPEFSQRGGMIQFVLEGARVRFEVNLTNTQEAGLNLSSELLKVAAKVTRNPHPGI